MNWKYCLVSRLLPLLLTAAVGLLLGGCSKDGGSDPGPAALTLQSLQINLEDSNLVQGLTTRARAAGVYSDNSSRNLNAGVDWFSRDPNVARIDSNGVVTALTPGTTVISIVVDGKVASAQLTVVDAQLIALEVSPANAALAPGVQQQFTATGIYSNGAANLSHDITGQVSWSSSAPAILAVSDAAGSKGLATAVTAGTANVSASFNGLTKTVPVTVSTATLDRIEISAPQTSVPAGYQLQLTATGIFSDDSMQDLSAQVGWRSADTGIATVDDNGRVTALAAGPVVISLDYLGQSATLEINVSAATLARLEFSPANPHLSAGEMLQLNATAIYSDGTRLDVTDQATWQSRQKAVATVGNTELDKGLLTAVASGNTTVAAYFNTQRGTSTVTVTAAALRSLEIGPSNPTIAAGTQQGFRVTGHYDDGSTRDLTNQVSWASSNKDVAEALSDTGYFKGLAAGTSRITAAIGSAIAFTDLTVTSATLSSISLSPTDVSIAKGYSIGMTATGIFSDASSQDISRSVIWQSANAGVATIGNAGSDAGVLRALAVGTTTISASLSGITQSTSVTVTAAQLDSLSIQLADNVMVAGTQQSLSATAHFSDSSSLDVTAAAIWTSSDSAVAAISNADNEQGRVTALSAGEVTLSAALAGIDASVALSVIDDPNVPVSVSLFASPNVILNDDTDSTTISVVLHPADSSGNIADNTTINVEISAGTTTTQQTLYSSNGSAAFNLKTNYSGFIAIQATVAGTGISASGYIYATPNFINTIAAVGFMNPQYDNTNTTLLADSWFALLVKNVSNRTFDVVEYRFNNGSDSETIPGDQISGGQLSGGELYGLIATLVNDQTDNGISGVLSLNDAATGQQFDINVVFTTP